MHDPTHAPHAVATASSLDADQALDQELEELRKRAEGRDAAEERFRKKHEIERLKLIERFEKELGGVEGEKFAVVDAGHRGFLVLKLGLAVVHKQFNMTIEANKKKGLGDSGITPEACHKFIGGCLAHPEKEEFQSVVEELPGLLYMGAAKLGALFAADREGARGK